MNSATPFPQIVAWVALDWADQQHVVRLKASDSPQVESFLVKQQPDAFHDRMRHLQSLIPDLEHLDQTIQKLWGQHLDGALFGSFPGPAAP